MTIMLPNQLPGLTSSPFQDQLSNQQANEHELNNLYLILVLLCLYPLNLFRPSADHLDRTGQ